MQAACEERPHARETAACAGGGHAQGRSLQENCDKIESLMLAMLGVL